MVFIFFQNGMKKVIFGKKWCSFSSKTDVFYLVLEENKRMDIIGRQREKARLTEIVESDQPAFVAI